MTHRRLETTRLRDATIALLSQTLKESPRGRLKQIERETGLSRTWLIVFARGEMQAPSVVNVECLYEYLTGRKIEL